MSGELKWWRQWFDATFPEYFCQKQLTIKSFKIISYLFLITCTSHLSSNSKSSIHEKVAPSMTVSSWKPCSQFGKSKTSILIGILFCHNTSCTLTKSLVFRHWKTKEQTLRIGFIFLPFLYHTNTLHKSNA